MVKVDMFKWFLNPPALSVTDELKLIAERGRSTMFIRIISFVFVSGCYFAVGYQSEALLFLGLLVPVELLIAKAQSLCLSTDRLFRRIDVLFFALTEILTSCFFVSLGLFAVTSASPSILLLGCLWIFGTLNYTSINFARWRYVNFLNIAPTALGLLLFAVLTGDQPLRPSTNLEWIMPIIGTCFLLFTTYELISDQRKTEAALKIAREEAAERLESLERIAKRDDLTGLLNRSAFNERLVNQLEVFKTTGKPFGYLLIDLDGFKPVNDGFGHPAGDCLLVEISARLLNTVGNKGFVGRIGGDEFSVVLPKIKTEDDLEDMALDLIRIAGLPVKFNDIELSVGMSIGAIIAAPDMETSEKITAAADEALYQAKENKKSSVVLYDPRLARKRIPIEDRMNIEAAIKDRRIKPFYQPKFSLKDGSVLGFEALARWPLDPASSSDSAAFVATIETLGLTSEFTYNMARQVFADVLHMKAEGLDPGQVSLNISEVSLATVNGLEDLQWLLAENQEVIPHITLEITEDVFISRAGARIRDSIKDLRNLGVRISLDDFGTGFASFQHLRQLEFDELKIDTEFVRGLGKDPTAEVIVDGFLSIAEGLGVSVVAEGVETEAQRAYLEDRGCLSAQGFLFSKARPFEVAMEFITNPPPMSFGEQSPMSSSRL